MKRLSLVSLFFVSCASLQSIPDFPAVAGERTLWRTCWDATGDSDLPSDTPPHADPCPDWEYIKYENLPIRVKLDDNAVADVVDLHNAVNAWNGAVGFQLLAITHSKFAWDIYVQRELPFIWLAGLAGIRKDGANVRGEVWLNGDQDTHVIAHELGHTLGVAHDVKDKGSLMYPYIGGTVIRDEDARALRWLYGKR